MNILLETNKIRKLMAVMAISLLTALFVPGTPAGQAADRTDAQNVQNDINNLNVALAEAVERYDEQAAKLDELNAQIDANQAELEKTVHELVTATDILEKRAVGIYKRGDVSSLEVIFSSRSLSDFIQQLDLLTRVGDRDAKIVEQIETQKKLVEAQARELASQRKQQETLTNDLAAQRDAIDAQLENKTNVLASILQDISAMDAAEAERAARQRSSSSRRGTTLYDVIGGMSGYLGNYAPGEWSDHGPLGHGVWLYEYGSDAYDLMCGSGVTVYAAHSGTVTQASYERGGVTIIEGGGFVTCYAHSEPYTVRDQYVSGGQPIARTNWDHVHFELVDNGEGIPAGDYQYYF